MRLVICEDYAKYASGVEESFSKGWNERAQELGLDVDLVRIEEPDLIDRVRGSAGFLWRFFDFPAQRLVGKRLLPAIEHGLGIPVFPDWRTIWHYDDKVAQYYLLAAAAIPTPRTMVFWDYGKAMSFCRQARFPLVLKLATGASSLNVRRLGSVEEAAYWIEQIFGAGVFGLDRPPGPRPRVLRRRLRPALELWLKGVLPDPGARYDLQKNCVLLQDFLPGNDFDTRITVIGNRAFGYRRFNRPNDFRASGSGLTDHDPAMVDIETVRLAFRTAQRLGTQSIAIDGLRHGADRVVAEVSYTYLGYLVHQCPGHWVLDGDPTSGRLEWVEGRTRPEDAIFEDFLAHLGRRGGRRE